VIDGRSTRRRLSARPALTATIAVANAPVSFGAFEVTVGDPHVPEAITVLDAVQRAGYAGIDLGPPGYLGSGNELRRRLSDRKLNLAGGYIAMPFSEPARMAPSLAELARLLDIFDQVLSSLPRLRGRVGVGAFLPKPTLADAGSETRRITPGRAHDDPSLMLDEAAWTRFAESMKLVTGLCRARGYEPTFHHHGASYVETPQEIEEMLNRTDVGLCLDTGHLLIGGGDPVKAAREWATRINHLHLKDVHRAVIDRVVARKGVMLDFWRDGAFCPLGQGDLDIDSILGALQDSFSGWLVVEQDMLPRPDESPDRAARDQQRNRDYLRARGL
jgi:inosose dehydratase